MFVLEFADKSSYLQTHEFLCSQGLTVVDLSSPYVAYYGLLVDTTANSQMATYIRLRYADNIFETDW